MNDLSIYMGKSVKRRPSDDEFSRNFGKQIRYRKRKQEDKEHQEELNKYTKKSRTLDENC